MKKHIFLLGATIGLGSIYACSYELPTTETEASTSISASSASSGNTGMGGGGGMGGGAGGIGGIGPIPPAVKCASGKCVSPDACCTDQSTYYECLIPFTCSSPGQISVGCDGPEDCPGMFCCGVWDDANSKYSSVSCLGECAAPNFRICHFGDPKPGCPLNRPCETEILLGPGYGYCAK